MRTSNHAPLTSRARAVIRTGESVNSLKSWLLERLVTASGEVVIWFRSAAPRARVLNPPNPRPSSQWSLLHSLYRSRISGFGQDGSLPVPNPARLPCVSIFRERSYLYSGVSRVVQPSQSAHSKSPTAHGLCARNFLSLPLLEFPCKPFCRACVPPDPLCGLQTVAAGCASLRRGGEDAKKAIGPPPLPGRWPSDPYRPVTGLRKRSPRSCPAGRASVLRHLDSPPDIRRSGPKTG